MRLDFSASLRRTSNRLIRLLSITVLASASLASAGAVDDLKPVLPPSGSYLNGASIGNPVPKGPDTTSETALLDLYLARAAQRDAPAAAKNEAFDDAAAYFFDDILPRFSQATGSEDPLTPYNKPILAHMLSWVLGDAMAYAKAAKADGGARARPYAETAPRDANGDLILDAKGAPVATTDIDECLKFLIKPLESYPSGHAMNGYSTALLLADVYPERRGALLARGARYGDNRVICGVHHPIDVERGRVLARAMFAKIQGQQPYKDDLACAKEEATLRPDRYSADCARRYIAYRSEMMTWATVKMCNNYLIVALRPTSCPAPAKPH